MHADDRFHPPSGDDPFWTETCWFTFAVPERRLSGQLYFRPNQGVTSCGVFCWDDSGDELWSCRYAKNLWHVPLPPDADLADLTLSSGLSYRCLEPLSRYDPRYVDADDGRLDVALRFDAIAPPNDLAESHLDPPGRYKGHVVLDGSGSRSTPTASAIAPGACSPRSATRCRTQARPAAATAMPPRRRNLAFTPSRWRSRTTTRSRSMAICCATASTRSWSRARAGGRCSSARPGMPPPACASPARTSAGDASKRRGAASTSSAST